MVAAAQGAASRGWCGSSGCGHAGEWRRPVIDSERQRWASAADRGWARRTPCCASRRAGRVVASTSQSLWRSWSRCPRETWPPTATASVPVPGSRRSRSRGRRSGRDRPPDFSAAGVLHCSLSSASLPDLDISIRQLELATPAQRGTTGLAQDGRPESRVNAAVCCLERPRS